jgi:hypothetical protein
MAGFFLYNKARNDAGPVYTKKSNRCKIHHSMDRKK